MQQETHQRSLPGLLADVSHDLRTPLNGILGFAELLHDGACGALTDEQRDCIHDILTSGRDLTALVNDIVDLARIDAGRESAEPKPFDPAGAVREVLLDAATAAGDKGVAIRLLDGPACRVVADLRLFTRVVRGFVRTAVAHTAAGGDVSISIAAGAAGRIRVSVATPGCQGGAVRFRPSELLNLEVATRCAALHGGAAGADALPDGGIRLWLEAPAAARVDRPEREETAC